MIFSDSNGQVVSGDRILALCALAMKEQGRLKHDTLVCTTMSNLGLYEAMRKNGIKVETSAVGDRNVIECMRKGGYTFGGENSGISFFSEISTT
ncbi:MAG: phosphoglucosamine mutase, partial [Luteolibacter sp.]